MILIFVHLQFSFPTRTSCKTSAQIVSRFSSSCVAELCRTFSGIVFDHYYSFIARNEWGWCLEVCAIQSVQSRFEITKCLELINVVRLEYWQLCIQDREKRKRNLVIKRRKEETDVRGDQNASCGSVTLKQCL